MPIDTHPKMANVNMSDDPRKERELNTITSTQEEIDEGEFVDEHEVLGSVHISKPTIKHVFFLLRPILKPLLEAFNKQEHALHELVNMMKLERTFLDKPVSISANVAYEVNYYDRKFLFVWSPVALSLKADDGSTIPVQASTWVQISMRRGTHLTAPAVPDTQPATILTRATDTLMSLDAVNAILYGTQTTVGDFPIGVDSFGRLKIGTAPANGGTLIGQVSQAVGGLTYANTWSIQQSLNNSVVAVGAGNTVIKNAPGQLVTIVVTTAGTTGFTVFDNATTNAGTQLYASKTAPALGDIYNIFGKALAGITIANTATGPALTVYFS